MPATWKFYEKTVTDNVRNPIAGEFFSTEAVGNVAEALVREGIQNSLDARLKSAKGEKTPAKVRISVSGLENALPASKAKRWFETLWPHITAPGNGLRAQPTLDQPCPFITYEDFGTTGLTGDENEDVVVAGKVNHFLNFFRAEGHSDKGSEDRGSWGVGKTVFPRSSRISSFLGLTVRHDDERRLLLGRSILKYHRLPNGTTYKCDGYFGVLREDGFMLPTRETATIDEFRNDFKLTRTTQSGLSIVVPWYDLDDEHGIDREKINAAVLRGFFYPVLMGNLSVTLAGNGTGLILDANTIRDAVISIGGDLAQEMLPFIDLAEWANTRLESEYLILNAPPPNTSQKWADDIVSAELVKKIRDLLSRRERVAIKVPMTTHPKDGSGPHSTFFKIFLEHSDRDSERPVFIRDELIISDVKSSRLSQVRSIVIVDDKPISTLLRDAETPAHTQWNQDTSNFKNKYKFGPGAINFVKSSVSELLRIVRKSEEQPDPSITIDFFSLPAEPDDDDAIPGKKRTPKIKPGPTPPTPTPPPPPKPRRFSVVKLEGGFGLRPGDDTATLPSVIDVRVAYDIRRGNPFRKYSPVDFEIGKPPIRIENQRGISVNPIGGNRLRISVTDRDFHIDVKGFDSSRDLIVKADAKESDDVSQED